MPIQIQAQIQDQIQAQILGQRGDAAEQRYCTQSGPFMIRFENGRAAGIFAALPLPGGAGSGLRTGPGPGAMAGVVASRTLEGVWTLSDRRGLIRIGFSEDWSSFIAAYAVEADPSEWAGGWMGYLPPAGDPADFVIDGERYHCE